MTSEVMEIHYYYVALFIMKFSIQRRTSNYILEGRSMLGTP